MAPIERKDRSDAPSLQGELGALDTSELEAGDEVSGTSEVVVAPALTPLSLAGQSAIPDPWRAGLSVPTTTFGQVRGAAGLGVTTLSDPHFDAFWAWGARALSDYGADATTTEIVRRRMAVLWAQGGLGFTPTPEGLRLAAPGSLLGSGTVPPFVQSPAFLAAASHIAAGGQAVPGAPLTQADLRALLTTGTATAPGGRIDLHLPLASAPGQLLAIDLGSRGDDGSPTFLTRFGVAVAAACVFAGFDYKMFNEMNDNPTSLRTYRAIQTAFQAGLSYATSQLVDVRTALGFNLLWWTWGCDALYYALAELNQDHRLFGEEFPADGAWNREVMSNQVRWASWTPVGIVRGDGKSQPIPGDTLVAQIIAGVVGSAVLCGLLDGVQGLELGLAPERSGLRLSLTF